MRLQTTSYMDSIPTQLFVLNLSFCVYILWDCKLLSTFVIGKKFQAHSNFENYFVVMVSGWYSFILLPFIANFICKWSDVMIRSSLQSHHNNTTENSHFEWQWIVNVHCATIMMIWCHQKHPRTFRLIHERNSDAL